MSVQPGWYIDPADTETRRYWDGEGWIGAPIPVDATPPEGPPPVEPPPAPPTPVTPGPAQVSPGSAPPAAGPPPGWPGHPGPPPGYGPPGHGPQGPGYGPPGFGPQSAPPGHGPQGPGYGPPGYGPQGAPPGYGPAGAPPGWAPPGWVGRMPEPRPHGLPLAGYGRRLAARLIDFAIVLALNVLVNGWFVWRFLEEMGPYWREVLRRAMEGDTSREGLPQIGEQAGGLQLAIVAIAAALWLAYEVPTTASSGQTLGKRAMRIKAVPLAADEPLGFGRALARWNTYGGVPTLLWCCFGLGLLIQLVDALSPLFDHPLRQALHDKRAQTVVVQLPDPAPTERPLNDSSDPRENPHDRNRKT
ncbi:RDD family protein [Micromonospora musae]|uniref:RDD family protein n=1 Tax=Micromonospora musae TaxID=1894970 RepID=UPI0033CFBE8E